MRVNVAKVRKVDKSNSNSIITGDEKYKSRLYWYEVAFIGVVLLVIIMGVAWKKYISPPISMSETLLLFEKASDIEVEWKTSQARYGQ